MDAYECDELTDADDVPTYRERATAEIDQIAQEAKLALADQGIDIPLFFLVPNSGDAILAYGTPGDPDNELWERVGEIVTSVVAQSIGLRGTQRRELRCATTHDQGAYDAIA